MDSTVEKRKALRVKVAQLLGKLPCWPHKETTRKTVTTEWHGPERGNVPIHGEIYVCTRCGKERGVLVTDNTIDQLLDYPNDLNACAQFEKTLTGLLIADYVRHLEHLVFKSVPRLGWSFALLTATATQRCEAYVAVMQPSKAGLL